MFVYVKPRIILDPSLSYHSTPVPELHVWLEQDEDGNVRFLAKKGEDGTRCTLLKLAAGTGTFDLLSARDYRLGLPLGSKGQVVINSL